MDGAARIYREAQNAPKSRGKISLCARITISL
jgi:hypothetical protein